MNKPTIEANYLREPNGEVAAKPRRSRKLSVAEQQDNEVSEA